MNKGKIRANIGGKERGTGGYDYGCVWNGGRKEVETEMIMVVWGRKDLKVDMIMVERGRKDVEADMIMVERGREDVEADMIMVERGRKDVEADMNMFCVRGRKYLKADIIVVDSVGKKGRGESGLNIYGCLGRKGWI